MNSDQQQKGLETDLTFDRSTAARLGVTVTEMDATLYDAFGQRQVSTIYNALNQYHVVMEVAPRYWQSPDTLKDVYISTSGGAAVSASLERMVPLAALSRYAPGSTRLSVNHHGLFASTTISFNLQDGMSLSDATAAITRAMQDIHMPTSIHGIFAGTAGTVAYTTVITAMQTLITAQQAALTIQQNRLVASITLIEALGGGWTTARL